MCPLQKKMMDTALMSQVGCGCGLWAVGCDVAGSWSECGHPRIPAFPVVHTHTCLPAAAQGEVAWVDAYHRRVWEALAPRLEGQAEELEWLKQATAPL